MYSIRVGEMKRLRYISVVVLLLLTSFTDSQEQCRTPKKTLGQCVEMNRCPTLYALLQSPIRKAEDIKFLRDSRCEATGKVCCDDELPCTTPSGESGVCTQMSSCPSLLSAVKLFAGFLPETVKNYLQESACQGVEQNSVCCGQTVPNFSTSDLDTVLDSQHCGTIAIQDKPYQISGTETYIDQFRWLALVEYRTSERQIKLLCGAVLIGPKYLLTAAHCVKGQILNKGVPVSVRLGEHNIDNEGRDCQNVAGGGLDCSDGALSIPIDEIITHPDYNPLNDTRHNDIALVRLQTAAPYTDFIRHICLPTVDVTQNLQSNSLNFSMAGWGSTESKPLASNRKLYYDMPFKTLKDCQSTYNNTIRLWDKQLCAGGVAGEDSCGSDSGGPLMYNVNNRYEVIGIVSFGPTSCETSGVPVVFSKVIEYIEWIRSVVIP